MRQADHLFYVANSEVSEVWVQQQNPVHESLADCYSVDRSGVETYALMTDRIVNRVKEGKRVCAAFYGHPGVLAQSSHAAIARLRRQGYSAVMLPGVSSDACLMADLGINPGDCGLSSFEATDFLVHARRFDPTSHLLIWQVGALGKWSPVEPGPSKAGVAELVRVLRKSYPAGHRVICYSAARLPITGPLVHRLRLEALTRTPIPMPMILWVPPLAPRPRRRAAIRILTGKDIAPDNMAARRKPSR